MYTCKEKSLREFLTMSRCLSVRARFARKEDIFQPRPLRKFLQLGGLEFNTMIANNTRING